MLKSMTGFGRGEFLDDHCKFVVEIKAVNHRYNEIILHMPRTLNALENKIKRQISSELSRGRIDVYITMDVRSEQKRLIQVDKELAIAYYNALRELATVLPEAIPVTVKQIATYPDVIKTVEIDTDAEYFWPKILVALTGAVDGLLAMRLQEGSYLEQDLSARLDNLIEQITIIEKRAPGIIDDYKERLFRRLQETLATLETQADDVRVLQEVACFAERINFTEEVVRFHSHCAQFRKLVSDGEPVGRKLDFLLQELNREANTIAAKASDYTVANIIVEIKSALEKIKEQIQNIE